MWGKKKLFKCEFPNFELNFVKGRHDQSRIMWKIQFQFAVMVFKKSKNKLKKTQSLRRHEELFSALFFNFLLHKIRHHKVYFFRIMTDLCLTRNVLFFKTLLEHFYINSNKFQSFNGSISNFSNPPFLLLTSWIQDKIVNIMIEI